MRGVLKAWLLRRLDALLTEEQRRLPPEELSRLRVVVGAAALNFLMAFSNMVGPEAPTHGTLFRAAGVLFSACYLGALVLVRRGAPVRRPALLVCVTLTLGLIFSTHLIGTAAAAASAASMLIPALVVYLLGTRLGLLFTGVMVLNVLVLHPLVRTGGALFFDNDHDRMLSLFAVISLLGGWVLSWLYSTARLEAHAALRESEGKLISLIENTDDLVCSLDAQGRILTANQAVRRLFREPPGPEPVRGEALFRLLLPESSDVGRQKLAQALGGQRVGFEVSVAAEGRRQIWDISLNPVLGAGARPVGVTLFGRDITERKEAELRLGEMHRSLMDASRQAGKAEVATGILHNVGNTLNSVNVSVDLVAERVRNLRLAGLARASAMLRENASHLATFLTTDPRGQHFPAYLRALNEQLFQDQAALMVETEALRERVDHIRAVVNMQQQHARSAQMLEQVPVPQLIDDALRLHGVSFERLGIQVRTEYAVVPTVLVDRHKLLQILLNLLSNARYALVESGREPKQLTLRVELTPEQRLRIAVADNGVGIPAEHLPHLFTQGFTTRKGGHGFGLHMSALTAQDLNGSLSCTSAGRNQGATFTIEFPLVAPRARA
ncbi:ATP-binding protein [Hyalangium rubrum]|uniref:histidine kinase n=1 Tax=Hyalangium rubrum TaxID=3103134 RepID=A0ABU5H1N2_9BACT|nr:ATP-binding protein [Hyalangium sp. s54d21]MDY7227357.1 ATP-binding protein [Hyalangium sp. s54d21]